MRHPDELRNLVGKKLARLFLEGNSKADCVRQVFPKFSSDNARKASPTIFRRYEVTRHVLDMLPSKFKDDDCEKLLHHLIDKAMTKQDDYLILQIIDRIAKIQGKFSDNLNIKVANLEEEDARVKEAEIVLRRAGVDPARINLN